MWFVLARITLMHLLLPCAMNALNTPALHMPHSANATIRASAKPSNSSITVNSTAPTTMINCTQQYPNEGLANVKNASLSTRFHGKAANASRRLTSQTPVVGAKQPMTAAPPGCSTAAATNVTQTPPSSRTEPMPPVSPVSPTEKVPPGAVPSAGPVESGTYILSLTQSDSACPSARACPGSEWMQSVCEEQATDFECESWWSSGMVGTFKSINEARIPPASVQARLNAGATQQCAACALTLKILIIRDSPLGFP